MTITLDRVTRINGLDNGIQHVVLDGVSVAFPEGRTVGILGTRGSGKSTLIKLLTGSLRPTAGRVRRQGRVSYPVGSFGWMNRYMTGRENLRFLARLYGMPADSIVDFVAEMSGLGDALDQYVGAYSGDKRSRLAFATSYAIPFDVYVADEFLVGGPPGFRDDCKDFLRQRQQHSTIILATRSPSLLRTFCDVGGVMHDGHITLYETVQDAVLEYAALMAMSDADEGDDGLDTQADGFWTDGERDAA